MDCQARGRKVRIIHHCETLYHQRARRIVVTRRPGDGTRQKSATHAELARYEVPILPGKPIPVATSRRWLLQVHLPHDPCRQELRTAVPSSGSAPGGSPGSYRFGALCERLCLVWSVHLPEQGRVVFQGGDVRMIRRERFLRNRQGTLVERFGLRIASLRPVEECQVMEGSGCAGIVRRERLLADRQGTLVERFSFLVPALVVVEHRQTVQAPGESDRVRFKHLFTQS